MIPQYPELFENPHVPQFGKQITVCVAKSQERRHFYVLIGAFFGVMMVGATVVAALEQTGALQNPMIGASISSVFMLIAIVLLAFIWNGQRPDALFVYDGGLHLKQMIRITTANRWFIYSFRRLKEITLSWRIVRSVRLDEKNVGGSRVTQAVVTLVDGKKLFIDQQDEAASKAIQTIMSKIDSVNKSVDK